MRTIHLICNAHIDPVWQWEWEEGAAETLSTFRVAAEFCEQYDGFVFNHNEALLYRWIEEYDPALFERIRKLVSSGQWHIMGGWHLQPDCNMPAGESLVRQMQSGLCYFKSRFGVRPTTAVNLDSFGHSRGLVQILKKGGYDSYLFCRPNESFIHLPDSVFDWYGYDGSHIMARRLNDSYSSLLGHAAEKVRTAIHRSDAPVDICLWGVGDHGGGPSRVDLEQLNWMKEELIHEGINLLHSTPEEYFAAQDIQGMPRPAHCADLNPWAPGCYTSQIRVKREHRYTENLLYMVEKMCAAAALNGCMDYPDGELREAQTDLLTVQFHDMLSGTSIQSAEDMALRMLNHGQEILSRVRARAFFAMVHGHEKACEGEIPILAFNPHPYPIEGDFVCEMSLWDQNWAPEFSIPQVTDPVGQPLATQCEKEASNINIDWRKRVIFHATLPPMATTRFRCRYERIPKKPVPGLTMINDHYIFKTDRLFVRISRRTGCLDEYRIDGISYLKSGAFRLIVMQDDGDPWGMLVTSFPQKVGQFSVMPPKDAAAFSGITTPVEGVHVIEDGAVRTVVEAVLRYRHSRAVVQYRLPKNCVDLSVSIRLQWMEVQRMVKLQLPVLGRSPQCLGQVPFGEEYLSADGRENVTQNYQLIKAGNRAVGLINDGVYGSSLDRKRLCVTLIRSPAYCAHPTLPQRPLIPQDRFTPHMDQGERQYEFLLTAGKAAQVHQELPRKAEIFLQAPTIMPFFPDGEGKRFTAPVWLEGDPVLISALKKADNGDGYILRLFNSSPDNARAVLHCEALEIHKGIVFSMYELKTFRLTKGVIQPCSLTEDE